MIIWLMDRLVRLLTKPIRPSQIKRPYQFLGLKVNLPPKVRLRRSRFLVPRNANAITYGNTIVFRPGCETLGTLMHELVHVEQWNRLGFWRFLWRYIRNKSSIERPAYEEGNKYK